LDIEMRCAICGEETLGFNPVKWGPEFAHRTCVKAFEAGKIAEREACANDCGQLSHIGSKNQLWMRDRCVAVIRARSNLPIG
jgi:hypothetical protein